MTILILSNWSDKIAELNNLTAPNKLQYAEKHGYDFENLKMPYEAEAHVHWLQILAEKLEEYDVVMTIGCDAVFVNQSIKIEDRITISRLQNEQGKTELVYLSPEVILAHDLSCCWPIQINNDVMIWPQGNLAKELIAKLIEDAPIWLEYPQLWQNHLWNLICGGGFENHVRLVPARQMNATYQPMTIRKTGELHPDGSPQATMVRIPGESSYALGDWVFHALDMNLHNKLIVIKWALQYVGDGSWFPDKGEMAERVSL